MKLGVCIPVWNLSVQQITEVAQRAEDLSFDVVSIPDHVLAPESAVRAYGRNWPDPLSMLAYVAGRTSRIQLATSVIVLPYRNPLSVAKAAATVDQASGGRLILGVGAGWVEEEFEALGINFAERGRMTDEYIQIIKTAWSSEVPSFEGKYYRFSGATFSPRPLQQPHPPIWVGGSPVQASRASLRRAVLLGDAWHPIALDLQELERGMGLLREMAAEAGKPDGTKVAPRNLLKLTNDSKGDGRGPFEGSALEIAGDVARAKQLGADYLIFDLPAPDVSGIVQLMERFMHEAKPALGS